MVFGKALVKLVEIIQCETSEYILQCTTSIQSSQFCLQDSQVECVLSSACEQLYNQDSCKVYGGVS